MITLVEQSHWFDCLIALGLPIEQNRHSIPDHWSAFPNELFDNQGNRSNDLSTYLFNNNYDTKKDTRVHTF